MNEFSPKIYLETNLGFRVICPYLHLLLFMPSLLLVKVLMFQGKHFHTTMFLDTCIPIPLALSSSFTALKLPFRQA